MRPVNLADFERLARDGLSRQAYDYVAGAAGDETTLAANRRAFERLELRPRVLVDVSEVDLSVELLGSHLELPVMLAPAAFQGLLHAEAEVATARGAAAAGALFVLSTLSSKPMAEVAAAAGSSPRWFQLYCPGDRGLGRAFVERAVEHAFTALCVTVDVPVVGRRERDLRNAFSLPPEARPADLFDLIDPALIEDPTSESALVSLFENFYDSTLGWKDLEWLRSLSSLPLVLKGILTAEDARLAVEHGVDALVVSNHGGRQLDGVPPTVTVLPEILEAVEGRIPVLIDSGFRRGTDVVKALALGAQAVLVGRPYLWALAAGGAAGVETMLSLLRQEIHTAVALLGCTRLDQLGSSHLRRPGAE